MKKKRSKLPLLRIKMEISLYFLEILATHSSTLAWKTSQMEEPGRLQSTWSPRVGHD